LGIYNKFKYNDGTRYGDSSKIAYSAEPLTVTAIGSSDYTSSIVTSRASSGTLTYGTQTVTRPKVYLHWTNPTGVLYGFRIVRNQEGYSENEEDGVIVLETYVPATPAVSEIYDELTGTPLTPGKFAYYTVWILLADGTWSMAAYNYCLIPKTHPIINLDNTVLKTSDLKFMELFPKVYSTAAQSYLDEVDITSDFYTFFSGMAYTLDETLTYADLLMPDVTKNNINPETVDLMLKEYALPNPAQLSTQRKKSLIKNASSIYRRKGTSDGVQLFSQSLTGFGVNVLSTPNMLLTPQDSTFYKNVGNWTIGANGVLTSNATTGSTDLPYQNELYSIDNSYTGKVVTSSTNVVMSLGTTNTKLTAIPVTQNRIYQFSYYIKGSTNTVTPSITWYDVNNSVIATVSGTATAASSTWTRLSFTATAPIPSVVIPTQTPTISSGTVTLTTSTNHGFSVGQSVTIFGLTPSGYNGTYVITGVPATNSFSFTNATTGNITVAGNVGSAGVTSTSTGAWFAALNFTFAAAGTYYLDMIQFSNLNETRGSSYYEPAGVEVNLLPQKINYFENPSLVDNSDTDWVSSGVNTATITAATGDGTTVTYTASNTFKVGAVVTVTGLGTASGTSLNLANITVASVIGAGPTYTGFTVTNTTTGTSSGTGTATGKGFILSTLAGIKLDGSNMTALTTTANTAFSLYAKSSSTVPYGQYYNFSIYAATVSGTENLSFKVEAYDSNDNLLNASIIGTANRTLLNQSIGTTFLRFNIPLFIPYLASGVYLKATAFSPTAVVPIQTPAITSGVVTLTTATIHGFKVGQNVTIAGLTPSGYNGTYTISAVSDFTFSFTNATTGNITVAGTATIAGNGNTIYFDAAQLEVGYTATDYFDGSYTGRGGSWIGTTNNSVSVMYRDKTNKATTLAKELPNMLPINSSFVITSGINGTRTLESSGWSS
jgi:hypothetical protein